MNIVKEIKLLLSLPRRIQESKDSQTPIKFKYWVWQKFLGFNRNVPWPVHFSSIVTGASNITVGVDVCPGYMPGCYIQGKGKISIGDYTQIAANVGIITANHDVHDNRIHTPPQDVTIGAYGWVGMNSVILPGVTLGDYTIVGAGSTVTKSFPDGYCVIAGSPAKIISTIDPSKVHKFKNNIEYTGYYKKDE